MTGAVFAGATGGGMYRLLSVIITSLLLAACTTAEIDSDRAVAFRQSLTTSVGAFR